MNWQPLSTLHASLFGENDHFLVTDGEMVYVVYIDHNELWFSCDHTNNYDETIKKLTHWSLLKLDEKLQTLPDETTTEMFARWKEEDRIADIEFDAYLNQYNQNQ